MMTPATYDLTETEGRAIRKGRDVSIPIQMRVKGTTTPINLVGCSVRAQIREMRHRDSVLIVEFTAVITDAVNGRLSLTLTDAQTADITQTKGFWDLAIRSAGGLDYNYCEGKVQFLETVSAVPA